MTANAWAFYDTFPEYIGDGSIDLDNDAFKLALFLSTSDCATTTNVNLADCTNQHANANGYLTGGQALDNVSWTNAAGTVTFDCDNEVFTAAGGPIVCRFAVIYDDTHGSDALACFSLLDNTPADVTVTDGNTLTIAIHASGIFALS